MTDIIKSIIEPTYRTEPEESGKLYPSQAKIIAERILQEKLDGKSSDDIEFAFEELSARITEDVRDCVKSSMNVGRYKVLVQATIGTMKDQGVKITSRCLWDSNTDNYATASYNNEFVFASVLVFFLYTD